MMILSLKKKRIMKYLSTIVIGISGLILALTGCDKKDSVPFYSSGTAPVLTSSTKTVAATAADSLSNVVSFSWTNPKYAKDSGASPVKYVLQIDSSGRGFSKAVNIVLSGALSDTLTAKQINTIVLTFGFSFNVAYNVDVRLISSYPNNNEQLTSNTVTISVTPYVTPPKVAPPSAGALFIVGSATTGGWTNPVPVPSQQFEKVDSVDYAGVFNLSAGGQYLLLPVNGDWTNKYAISSASIPATGGSFGYNGNDGTYNTNFTGPATAGLYEIWLNFQTGTFTVTPYAQFLPDSLFIVGAATPGGWNNPVPDPGQAFSRLNSTQFKITLPMSAAGQYLLLPINGSWTNKFAVANGNVPATGGPFGYNGSNGTYNTNFNGPASAGTYTLIADFLNYTYTVAQ
jgi:hypothetical protein